MAKSLFLILGLAVLFTTAPTLFAETKASSIEDDKKTSATEETPAESEQKSRNWLWEAVEEQRKLKEDQAAAKTTELKKQFGDKDDKSTDPASKSLTKDNKKDSVYTFDKDKKNSSDSGKNSVFSKWTTSGISNLSNDKLNYSPAISEDKKSSSLGLGSGGWGSPSGGSSSVSTSGSLFGNDAKSQSPNLNGVKLPGSSPTAQNNSSYDYSNYQHKPDVLKAPTPQNMNQVYQQRLGESFRNAMNPQTTPVPIFSQQQTKPQQAVSTPSSAGRGRVKDPNDYLSR